MEKILGNVFIRTMHFEKAGERREGHTHNFDHVTYVLTGGIKVRFKKEENGILVLKGERDYWAPKQIAGDTGESGAVLIKRDIHHEIIALADHTHCHCIFAHRDPITGEVVQEWNGWMEAAQ